MAPRDEDVGWNFGDPVDGNKRRIKCIVCNKIINGSITRLKQHLAHKKGDVAPCEYESAEVKRDMMSLLMKYKDKKKRDKQRMDREYEEELIKSMNRPNDDDDDEMQWVMRQSRAQLEFDYYRGVHGRSGNYDDGGSSSNPQMNKSASVREVGYGRGRNMPFQPTSTQATKKAVLKAWGNYVIDTNLPFRAVESSFANPLMDTIREYPQVRAPSAYEIAEDKADKIMKIQEPILKVLRLIDGDFQPTMGFIYEAMERWVKNVISKLERNLEAEVRALQQETEAPVFEGDDLSWLNDDDDNDDNNEHGGSHQGNTSTDYSTPLQSMNERGRHSHQSALSPT
ncbi:DNA-directed RNA polymerase subunit L [Bienertia sinuspersici]